MSNEETTTVHLLVGDYLACGENPIAPKTWDIDKVTCKYCQAFAPAKKTQTEQFNEGDADCISSPVGHRA